MGTRTLVELIQQARSELGLLPYSTSVASSNDFIDIQMVALINRVGDELQRQFSWAALQTEFIVSTDVAVLTTGDTLAGSGVIVNIPDTSAMSANSYVVSGQGIPLSARIVTVDSPTQITLSEHSTTTAVGVTLTVARDTYAGPADIQSYISDTWWDRTNRWKLLGPTSPQTDQFLRSGIVTTSPRRNWRQIGRPLTNWRIWPPPATDQPTLTMVYEYMSLAWATASDGTFQGAMVADADTCVFPDDVMVTGCKAKFFQAKGMDTKYLDREFSMAVERAKAVDGGAPIVTMARRSPGSDLLSWFNIPPDGYGPRP